MSHPSFTNRPLSRSVTTAALLASLAGVAAAGGCRSSARAPQPGDVNGRYIVAIGDADMAGFGSGDGLGADGTPAQDTLTVIDLPIVEPRTPFAQITVSNSALGTPSSVAVNSNGTFAYVVETRGPAGAAGTGPDGPAPGSTLTAVDLSNPLEPRPVATIPVGNEPMSVAVRPGNEYAAVATRVAREQLVLVPLTDGVPSGEAQSFPLVGLDDDAAAPATVAWHPSGSVLGVTLPGRDEVMFYKFRVEDGGGLAIAPWGAPVRVGRHPWAGAFTTDGRFFLTADTQSDRGSEGFDVGTSPGRVTVVRVAEGADQVGDDAVMAEAQHEVVSDAEVGIGPAGLAISPDGRLVATANTQRSIPAEGPADELRGGSISLLTLDRSGQLVPAGEYPNNAVPAGIAFDREGRFVIVTQFRSFDPDALDGELAFWGVRNGRRGGAPSLQQGDFYVGVGKGPHGVLIVR